MASNAVRRPLPALIALVALLLLTALVWWRVINRDDATVHTSSKHCTSSSASPSGSSRAGAPAAPPTTTLPKPSSITVLVLNSTHRTGIAADARTGLIAGGFRSPKQAANFEGKAKITGVGQLRYGAASQDAATLLRYYIPGMTLVRTPTHRPLVTVVLGPKYDGVLSGAQVQKSLAAARTTTSASPSPTPTKTSSSC
ncbi:LytR C-terminal domain-containing protein [Jatrophihabitans endophyticus]|uniref:LytR C-terminal domain-containing protein n=1 Tax=Jatrophihabitans endophyticus TaxID=1206085 RepID=UPI0019EE4584|nr:LytR C-terminal domain-containing protein [Jatrophihabitans endophyticus]MBE7186856.1 LytR C-terminal domain-containing protein [Jatrophihabitans endophyticus]